MALGTLITSWNAPFAPNGMEFDGRNLYILYSATIRKYNLEGIEIDSWALTTLNPRGLTFDGRNFWYGDFGDNQIYCIKIDRFGLRIVGSIPAINPIGVVYDGKYLISSRAGVNLLEIIDIESGNIITQLNYGALLVGLYATTFDGRCIWACGGVSNLVYCLSPLPTIGIITTFATVNPRAIALDGKNLWVAQSGGGNPVQCYSLN